jgi:preprotein translocase subunit SecE
MNPLNWIADSRQYFTEVRVEWKKITWPQQSEAVTGTISVVVVTAVLTTALGLVDYGLSLVMRLVLQ